MRGVAAPVTTGFNQNSGAAGLWRWLSACGLPTEAGGGAERIFRELAGRCGSLDCIGRGLLWFLICFPQLEMEVEVFSGLRQAVMGKCKGPYAMHRGGFRRARPHFPLPLVKGALLKEAALGATVEEFVRPHFAGLDVVQIWTALSVMALNAVAGHGRAILEKNPSKSQRAALGAIAASVNRMLVRATELSRSPSDAEKELSERFVSYTGEEVPKMQVLRLRQALPALPPQSHGGCIDARNLVGSGTRWFLDNAEASLLKEPPKGVKLQAKVHVDPSEALDLFKLLVDRKICSWIRDDAVLRVGSQQVLSGMFAVGKGSFLADGSEVQRIIMNLIPSNAVFKHAQGGTADLPSITQYLSLVLKSDERVFYFQSDMTSAFYLFRIPICWHPMMAFNIGFTGEQLGFGGSGLFRPCCSVIPMGWASAVSVMQEIAETLTKIGRLPAASRVRRTAPLPPWLVDTCEVAASSGRPWFHVYLDNFCGMEKVNKDERADAGGQIHSALEAAWRQAGVLSSSKKKVSGEPVAHELGAMLQGDEGTLGPSPERVLKLVQTTLVVIGRRSLSRKWVQVIAGRWVHCMSFRRPAMVWLDVVWTYIAGKAKGPAAESRVRSEFMNCICGCLLMHTNLRAMVSSTTTASDASSTGGAVGKSEELTLAGQEFVGADLNGRAEGIRAPILLLSLFNGIGCAFRCYDLCGITPAVCISYELCKAANRVTSRRWPQVKIELDVRSLTEEHIREWKYLYPEIEEIHIWAGFPCVGLSAVRFGRLNLDDPQSGLFWEVVRIIRQVRQVYGYSFPVKFAAENVASMDVAAEREISETLGIKPWRFDSADVVPVHRPRFCWSNTELTDMGGVEVKEKDRWWEIKFSHNYPALDQWVEEGCVWPGFSEGAVLPTCMKAIRRSSPQ